jgi:Ferritin-like domain
VSRVRATRREALAAAGAGLGAAALAGTATAAIDKDLQKKLEKAAVSGATFGELTKTVAFEAIANGRLLGPRETATIRVLRDHAVQHATLLTTVMKDELGTDAPLAPKRAAIPGLLAVHDRDAALRLALDLERRAIGRHMRAVRVARDAQVMRALAGIVGSDGQHLVLVRQLLHQEPVPSAFETGIR